MLVLVVVALQLQPTAVHIHGTIFSRARGPTSEYTMQQRMHHLEEALADLSGRHPVQSQYAAPPLGERPQVMQVETAMHDAMQTKHDGSSAPVRGPGGIARREEDMKRRCAGTHGGWCEAFLLQHPIPTKVRLADICDSRSVASM